MSFAKKVAYNTFIQALGRFGTTIVSLVMVAILNDSLGKQGWGTYYAVTAYAGFFAVFADLGLNTLFLRELSRYPEKVDEITKRYLGFRVVTAVSILSIAPLTALIIPVYQNVATAVLLASVSQLLLVLNQLFVSILQARLTMDRAVLSDFIGRVLTLAGIVVVAQTTEGSLALTAILSITIAGNLLTLITTYFFVRKFTNIICKFDIYSWPDTLRKTLPMAALAVLGVIHFRVDSIMLTAMRGEVDVGIYGNAYKIIEIALVLPGIFVGSLIPALNQAYITKDPNHNSFIQKAFDVLIFIAVPFVVALIVFAAPLMRVLTENNVEASALSLRILSFAILSWFLGTLFSNILLAADRQKQITVVELLAVIANIGINLYAIRAFSYIGAAYTTVITEALSLTAIIILCFAFLRKLPTLHIFWKSLLLAIPLGFATWYLSTQLTWVLDSRFTALFWTLGAGSVFLILYIGLALLFRMLPPVISNKIPWAYSR